MRFHIAALALLVALATLPVIADRTGYQSSARISNAQRSDLEEDAAMRKVAKISLEQAKTIAAKAAPGLTMTDADLDNEDGNVVYEIEFDQGGAERTIVIDAGNGKILADTVDND